MSEDKFKNEQSFIVQNVMRGPHMVSDIKLQFAPLEMIDLGWEADAEMVKSSRDLRTALTKGYLKRITRAEFDRFQQLQAEKERKELARQHNVYQTRKLKIGDNKFIDAEMLDSDKGRTKAQDSIKIAGTANDPLSYSVALELAQLDAEMRGDELTAIEFAELVDADPDLVPRLLRAGEPSSESGAPRPATAYYADAGGSYEEGTLIKSARMKRSKKDDVNMIHGKPVADELLFDNFDDELAAEDDAGFAEEIDLSAEITNNRNFKKNTKSNQG